MKRSFAIALAFAAAVSFAAPSVAHAQPRPRDHAAHAAVPGRTAPVPAPSSAPVSNPVAAPLPAHATAPSVPPSAPVHTAAPAEKAEHGAHEGSEGAAEAEEGHAPKPINWTDLSNKEQPPLAVMFLNFAILLGLYYRYGKKPIAEGLKNRRATVAREIEEARRMQKEAEARAAKYQEKLSHLEAELKDTRDTLQAAGEAERDRLIREAEEKATRMERDATFLVEQELKQLRAELTRETVETAILAAEELLRKRITSSDQERLAEDYLAQLAAKRPSGHERVVGASIPPASAHGGGE